MSQISPTHRLAMMLLLAAGVQAATLARTPIAGLPASAVRQEPAEVLASALNEAASAQLGLAAAMNVLTHSIGEAKVEIAALDCQMVAATEKAAAHVAVDLDLRVFAETSAAAEAAFLAFESALRARARDEKAPAFDYDHYSKGLLVLPFVGNESTEKPTEKQLERSYQGRVKVALPGSVLHRKRVRKEVPEGAKPIDPKDVSMFVRALTARDTVQFGEVKISQLKPSDKGASPSFRVEPQGSKEKAASISAAKLSNLLYLLEKDTSRINIARVQFGGAAGNALTDVKILIAPRER